MKRFYISLFVALFATIAMAQKTVYIPQQTLKDEGYDPSTTANNLNVPWCRYRSRESENIIVFWAAGYGNNDPNSSEVPEAYRVDIDDMLEKLESFYDLNVNQLGFADISNSKLSKYKMVICLYYTTDWMAYGGGFDNVIGGMWVSPSTCHPVGQTIAHEIGHSFQYQCYCDLGGYTGFRYATGNGSAWWEATANWQSAMAYPDLMYALSLDLYRRAHNMAMTHEWMRYQSYWMFYWWCDRHGMDMMGRLWRGSTHDGYDINEVYMEIMGLNANGLYKEYMDANAHLVTWDFNNTDWKQRGSYYDIGNFMYSYVPLSQGEFQVAYSSCPQATGFNVIPLEVPAAGTEISTHFTALTPGCSLAEGDPRQFWNGAAFQGIDTNNYNSFAGSDARGFRVGYVALKQDGTRVYSIEDQVYCTGTAETSVDINFNVPSGVSQLWFVVSPAPTRYFRHLWDENITNDDQWPYRVKFSGTNIPGASKFYLYDQKSDRFISRGGDGGTRAVADEFGLPVVINISGTGVNIQMLDNQNAYLGGSSTVSTIGELTEFTPTETSEGTTYRNAAGKYLTIDTAGNIVMADNQTNWQIVTAAERNKIIAYRLEAREKEIGALANVSAEEISLANYAENNMTATDMTSKINNAELETSTTGWTVTGSTPSPEANVLEVYQGTGTELSQTITGLPKGLYRVSLHAFYRDG